MQLLIIVLNKDEYLEKIMSLLAESEINGVTIFDSEGIGHYLAYEVPIFAGLRQMVGEGKNNSKTIMALLCGTNAFNRFKELLKEEEIDFTRPGTGIVLTVPVNEAIKSEESSEWRC